MAHKPFLLWDLSLDAALARSPAKSSPSATWPGLHRIEIENPVMTQTADSSVRCTPSIPKASKVQHTWCTVGTYPPPE
jgi:hypothetical protein